MSNGYREEFITRHRDLVSHEALGRKIIIVGAGAIGSFVTLALAKMGYHNLHVYDFDTVETENIGAQFFDTASIGKKKVVALQEMVWNFTSIRINAYDYRIMKEDVLDTDLLITAVDNMEVRKMLSHNSNCHWLIDPRMGAEYATMEVVQMADVEAYKNYAKTLFTDSEAVQERCTAKTTIYTVLLIAGQVVKAVKDITMAKESITSLDWSIRDNAMLAFSNGRRL